MPPLDATSQMLALENQDLRRRLAEANETLEAIRNGEVDALVVRQGSTNQVFTLDGAERPYRMFVEEMQQGAVTLGHGGTILYCNQRFAEMLGVPQGRLAGTPFEALVLADSRDAWRALLRRTGQGRAAGELTFQRQDGTPLPAFITVSPMAALHGAGLAAVVADLTEQKHFERLAAAERQAQELLAAAGQASRAKDRFLAMLGHELRNPLGPIRNAAALMKLAGSGDPVIEAARTVIERQAAQMTRLIDDLLDVSRIANGKIVLRPERLDLAALAATVVADHRPLFEAKDLILAVSAPAELPALGDPVRLAQILGNLLVNACKFTDPGGRVTVRLGRGGAGEAVLAVADTGIGIAPADLETLFDTFMQVEQAQHRSAGGLGLGLALVKELAGLHGGGIQARSPGLGQGSEFIVSLPILLDRPEPVPAPAAEPGARRPRRILVIEDNVDAADTLRMLLEFEGHAVAVAHSGPAGLEAASGFKPQLVLCDIGLPGGMDGYAVASALRAAPELAPLCLVAMTGFSQEADRQRALGAGFDLHLAKPADPEELLRLLDRPEAH